MAVLSLNSLPIGFRFRPTDKELIDFYLRSKINGKRSDEVRVIREIDVCKCEPWDLPHLSAVRTRDPEWFFFCPLDRKYPNGNRLNRATKAGYWKATGKDRKIKSGSSEIGMKRTLVFYTGRAPMGKRTKWVMHEYRTTLIELDGTRPGQNPFVICRLFKKQDESVEDKNGDEVDPAEDMQSELVRPQDSPAVEAVAEKFPDGNGTCPVDLPNEVICNSVAPILECNINDNDHKAYGVTGQVAEIVPAEVDPVGEVWNLFDDPVVEPLDCILVSPLHSQSQIEAEQAPCMFDHVGNSFSGVEFKNGTNENDAFISDFLNSILNNSDDYYSVDSGIQKNSVAEIVPAEVDPVGEALNHFYDPTVEPPDCIRFSPLHSQIEAEQAPWMFGHVGNTFSGVEFKNGTNENDAFISDVLNSILNNSDDYYSVDSGIQKNSAIESESPKAMPFANDLGPCTEPDAEAALVLLGKETANRGAALEIKSTAQNCTIPICEQDVSFSGAGPFCDVSTKGELSNHVNINRNLDNAITGIRIRSRPAQIQPNIESSVTQGNAPRRLRLQCKLQVGPIYCPNSISNCSEGKEDDSKPVVTKEVKVMEEDIAAGTGAARGTMDKSQEISICEEIPSQFSKKVSARRLHKPLGVMFWVALILILFTVLLITLNVL